VSPALPPVTSVRYRHGEDALATLDAIVEDARAAGLRVAGALQRDAPVPGHRRCGMQLEDLGTGRRFPIARDRGRQARGCHLDLGLLAEAEVAILSDIAANGADLVVLNKFGKSEAMGGGLRAVVVAALEAGIPAVVGVPLVNLEAWQAFVGGLSGERVARPGDPLVPGATRPRPAAPPRAPGG